MDKGLAVQKRVLIVWLKIPQMPQNLSGQFVCPSPKVLDYKEKRASLGVRSPCPSVLGNYWTVQISVNACCESCLIIVSRLMTAYSELI